MGPNNENRKAVDRFCQSLEVNKTILANYDSMAGTLRSNGKQSTSNNIIDLRKIVLGLQDNEAIERKKIHILSRKKTKFALWFQFK